MEQHHQQCVEGVLCWVDCHKRVQSTGLGSWASVSVGASSLLKERRQAQAETWVYIFSVCKVLDVLVLLLIPWGPFEGC